MYSFASQIIPYLSNKHSGLSKVGRLVLDLLFVFILEMCWSKVGLSQERSKYRHRIQIIQKRSGRNTVFISDTIKVCVCVINISVYYVYTHRDVCVCVCVWFELHCTNTFSPAKGCLELVDSSQAPWHLAYCGEIVLLTHSGRTWQTSKSNQRIWDMWLNLKICIFMISSWHFRGVHGIPKSRWVELDCNWLRLNLTLHTCIYDIQYTYHIYICNYIYIIYIIYIICITYIVYIIYI